MTGASGQAESDVAWGYLPGPRQVREGRQCSRYRRDGQPCTNPTAASDGWCRAAGCDGFVRPYPIEDREHHEPRAPFGTRRHVAETGHLQVALDIDEIEAVRVSQRARDTYRYHHRGSDAGAEVALRQMLGDFLITSARSSAQGYVTLAREGYQITLSPDASTIVGYATVHRERTWAQVKAGVRSRYGRSGARRCRPERGGRLAPGPALPPSQIAASIDTGQVHLTSRVRTGYDRIRQLGPPRRGPSRHCAAGRARL